MNRLLAYLLLALAPFTVLAQDSRRPITNADVISMTKSGLGSRRSFSRYSKAPQLLTHLPRHLSN